MRDRQVAFTIPEKARVVYKMACAKLGRAMAEDLRGRVLLTIQEARMLDSLDIDALAFLTGRDVQQLARTLEQMYKEGIGDE